MSPACGGIVMPGLPAAAAQRELRTIKGGGTICLYVPDFSDVQSPGVTENPASGVVQGIGRGPTKASVETD